MSAFKVKNLGYMAAASALLALFAAQGCGDSDDSQATPSTGGKTSTAGAGGKTSTAGTAGKTSVAGSPGAAGSTPMDEAGAGGSSGMAGEGGMGGEAGGGSDCTDPTGCYTCVPTTNLEFLNACVENGCPAHFDNSTLTQIAKVGTL